MSHSKDDHFIVVIHVTNRMKQAGSVQKLLTQYGANIKTRIGLHEVAANSVSPNGVIVLEMVGGAKRCNGIVGKLNAITGVEAKSVVFDH